MNSTGNKLSEVLECDPSRFSRCRAYFKGKVGEGTAWEYATGHEQFEVEITPEQAFVMAQIQDRFSITGVITGYADPDSLEEKVLRSLPDIFVNRFGDRIELSINAQIALYDLIE